MSEALLILLAAFDQLGRSSCIYRKCISPFGRFLAPLLLGLVLASTPTRAQTIPADAQYVSSSGGRVYYPVACDAWRGLRSELRFFGMSDDAEAAGYTPTTNRRCQGLFEQSLPADEFDVDEPASYRPAPGPDRVGPSPEGSCVVSRVVDGDTLDCSDGLRIRLLLIDAPEMAHGDFGAAAKAALEQLAPLGSKLVLEYDVDPRDRYGRTLAYLWSRDVLINAQMIAGGMAVVATYPPNVKYADYLLPLQVQAREERRGLWSVDAFECAPADFRARRCR